MSFFMQEKNKKHILRFFALVITLLYVMPMGYCLGLWIGAILVTIIFSPLMLLITTKSYEVALNVILFFAGLVAIHIVFHAWTLFNLLKGSY